MDTLASFFTDPRGQRTARSDQRPANSPSRPELPVDVWRNIHTLLLNSSGFQTKESLSLSAVSQFYRKHLFEINCRISHIWLPLFCSGDLSPLFVQGASGLFNIICSPGQWKTHVIQSNTPQEVLIKVGITDPILIKKITEGELLFDDVINALAHFNKTWNDDGTIENFSDNHWLKARFIDGTIRGVTLFSLGHHNNIYGVALTHYESSHKHLLLDRDTRCKLNDPKIQRYLSKNPAFTKFIFNPAILGSVEQKLKLLTDQGLLWIRQKIADGHLPEALFQNYRRDEQRFLFYNEKAQQWLDNFSQGVELLKMAFSSHEDESSVSLLVIKHELLREMMAEGSLTLSDLLHNTRTALALIACTDSPKLWRSEYKDLVKRCLIEGLRKLRGSYATPGIPRGFKFPVFLITN